MKTEVMPRSIGEALSQGQALALVYKAGDQWAAAEEMGRELERVAGDDAMSFEDKCDAIRAAGWTVVELTGPIAFMTGHRGRN